MSNFHRHHGCSGCGGHGGHHHGRCHHDNQCGTPFRAIGPFVGVEGGSTVQPRLAASRIPFASGGPLSGGPAVLTTTGAGLIDTTSWIGFGATVTGVGLVAGGNIDLGVVGNVAFSVQEPGNLTAISASFTVVTALTAGTSATVNARIYRAPAGSNIFSPTAATVNLVPTLTTTTAAGTVLNGVASNFSVPVAAGDRLLMVFSMTGTTAVATATGTASAGLTIE